MLLVDRTLAQVWQDVARWRGIRFAEAAARLWPESGSCVLLVGGGHAIFAGKGSPANKVKGLGFGPISAETIDQIELFYRQVQEPVCTIELCPLGDPSLLPLLQARGYAVTMFLNMLARPSPTTPLPVRLPQGARLERVSAEMAGVWSQTTASGFVGHDAPSQTAVDIQATTFHGTTTDCFLVWMEGEPVAGGAMARHGRGVELGGSSTRVAFRGLGLHTALVHARLNHARTLGLEWNVVLTTPGSASQRNLERVGFRLAYTNALVSRFI